MYCSCMSVEVEVGCDDKIRGSSPPGRSFLGTPPKLSGMRVELRLTQASGAMGGGATVPGPA